MQQPITFLIYFSALSLTPTYTTPHKGNFTIFINRHHFGICRRSCFHFYNYAYKLLISFIFIIFMLFSLLYALKVAVFCFLAHFILSYYISYFMPPKWAILVKFLFHYGVRHYHFTSRYIFISLAERLTISLASVLYLYLILAGRAFAGIVERR